MMRLDTRSGAWLIFETREGGECLWLRDVYENRAASVFERCAPLARAQCAEIAAALDFMGYRDAREIEIKFGFCARYSAPGYLDCTPWCGPYVTRSKAQDEARAMYGDEDENSISDES